MTGLNLLKNWFRLLALCTPFHAGPDFVSETSLMLMFLSFYSNFLLYKTLVYFRPCLTSLFISSCPEGLLLLLEDNLYVLCYPQFAIWIRLNRLGRGDHIHTEVEVVRDTVGPWC